MPGRMINRKNEARLRDAWRALRDLFADAKIPEDDTPDESTAPATATEAGGFSTSDLGELLQTAIRNAYMPDPGIIDAYRFDPRLIDVYDTELVYREGWAGNFYRVPFTVDASGAVTLGTPSLVVRKVTYVEPGGALTESAAWYTPDQQIYPISEAAIAPDGTARVKLIGPGWGSSGYYSPEVLKRDGTKLYRKGVQMFWDHATPAEEAQRPEGSLDRLAGVLEADAVYDVAGPKGPGLYAPIRVFDAYRSKLDELAPYIGTSIRAMGRARLGEAEGKRGPIIEELTAAKSVDFVTVPGAGGAVLQLFEAARGMATSTPPAPQPVGDETMTDEQIAALVTAAVTEAIKPLAQGYAQLRESNARQTARGQITAQLADPRYAALAPTIKERITSAACASLPLNEAGQLDAAALRTATDKLIEAEIAYLVSAGAGRGLGAIRGMGESQPLGESGRGADAPNGGADLETALNESFTRWGLTADEAKIAARGRA